MKYKAKINRIDEQNNLAFCSLYDKNETEFYSTIPLSDLRKNNIDYLFEIQFFDDSVILKRLEPKALTSQEISEIDNKIEEIMKGGVFDNND